MALDPAGEHLVAQARLRPDRPAVVMVGSGETLTYAELDDRAERLARLLRERGLRTGDHLAVLVANEPAFFVAVWAAMRTGLYVTPINWHLTPAEAGYIVRDCDATALVWSSDLAEVVDALDPVDLAAVEVKLSTAELDDALDAIGSGPVDDEHEGSWMFYSSGTTGRPKGILPPLSPAPLGGSSFLTMMLGALFGFDEHTTYLCPAPLYHAAPAGWSTGVHRLGGTTVVMESFDPIGLLEAVERHRVTHVQLVPTHMIRLLKLPSADRERFDLSSLRMVVHAAAPCPVEVKRDFMAWVGPIVHEYYSGSEGVGFCRIGPEEWLAHPGSVGRSVSGTIRVLGPDGEEVPAGAEGEIWFEGARRFEYHKDPAKTADAFDERGWSWLGDVGHVDEEGYLYLTDRAGHMIISGGVNIYPREAEDALVVHPAVADVAVLGTPDTDMGERVTAFVQLAPGATADADELIAWTRDRLSHFKCPTEIRFVDELPRLPTGKLLKRNLLDPSD